MKTKQIIRNAIRTALSAAIESGEMSAADQEYIRDVLAPGIAKLASQRIEAAEKRAWEKSINASDCDG